MEDNGFMANTEGPWFTSRDYHMAIKCSNKNCPLRDIGNGNCGMPSALTINSVGECYLYQKYKLIGKKEST